MTAADSLAAAAKADLAAFGAALRDCARSHTEAIIATLQRTDRGRQTLAALAPLAALWPELDREHRAGALALVYALETHTGTIGDACSAAAQPRRKRRQPQTLPAAERSFPKCSTPGTGKATSATN